MIGHAIKNEHARITLDRADEPKPLTEIGRDLKKQTDVPTVLIDRTTDHITTEKLKPFTGRGKPS